MEHGEGRRNEFSKHDFLGPHPARMAQVESSLYAFTDSRGRETPELTLKEIAVLIARDRDALRAALEFLRPGGRGYERDQEAANDIREKLAWELVDELSGHT